MKLALNLEFEKAVRLLVQYFPVSSDASRKPILFHDIRVGVSLYERGYSREIVLAGLLHDSLEWSEISEEILKEQFGQKVVELVQANTKNDSIVSPQEKIQELIQRCSLYGLDALIIKAADILDSFKWYDHQHNEGELLYCVRNANAILETNHKKDTDSIFAELESWQQKYAHLAK